MTPRMVPGALRLPGLRVCLARGDEKPLNAARHYAAARFRLEPIDSDGLGQRLAGA